MPSRAGAGAPEPPDDDGPASATDQADLDEDAAGPAARRDEPAPPPGGRAAKSVRAAALRSGGTPISPARSSRSVKVEWELAALAEALDAVWYVRLAGGGQFGPASADHMREWLVDGRIREDSYVWREGWPDWRLAGPLFFRPPPEEMLPAQAATAGGSPRILTAPLAAPRIAPRQVAGETGPKRSAYYIVILLVLLCLALLVALVVVLR